MPRLVLLGLLAAGCAGPPDREPVHPVAGTLLVNGRPAALAGVGFHRPGRIGVCPSGLCGPDGGFTLTTHSFGDGAPEGEYVVTVFWPVDGVDECAAPDPTCDRLGGRYMRADTSDLRATVRPGANTLVLHATVGGQGWNTPRVPTGR